MRCLGQYDRHALFSLLDGDMKTWLEELEQKRKEKDEIVKQLEQCFRESQEKMLSILSTRGKPKEPEPPAEITSFNLRRLRQLPTQKGPFAQTNF